MENGESHKPYEREVARIRIRPNEMVLIMNWKAQNIDNNIQEMGHEITRKEPNAIHQVVSDLTATKVAVMNGNIDSVNNPIPNPVV